MPYSLALNHVIFFPISVSWNEGGCHNTSLMSCKIFCDITMTLVTGSVATAKLWSGNKFCGLLIIFHISQYFKTCYLFSWLANTSPLSHS